MKKNSIVIIGGMGPQASARLVTLMVEMCTRDFGIKIDSDFPEIILDSVPVPNCVSDKRTIKVVSNILEERVRKLEKFNPAYFAIACNTAHILLPKLQKKTFIPFLSIIEEVADSVERKRVKSIGLLATPITIQTRLYQKALEKRNIKVITPNKKQIKNLDSIIRRILAGQAGKNDEAELRNIALSLVKKRAEGVILGCTELPLVFPKDFEFPIFDSIEILARGLLEREYSQF